MQGTRNFSHLLPDCFFVRCKQVVVDKASMLVGLFRLFLSFLLFLINPIFDMFSPKPTPSTPPPSAVAVFHAQATSDAFSDEEPDMTTMSHESDLAVPLRDSDLGIQDSDSVDPDSSRTRSYSPPARTPHRYKITSTFLKITRSMLGASVWQGRREPTLLARDSSSQTWILRTSHRGQNRAEKTVKWSTNLVTLMTQMQNLL